MSLTANQIALATVTSMSTLGVGYLLIAGDSQSAPSTAASLVSSVTDLERGTHKSSLLSVSREGDVLTVGVDLAFPRVESESEGDAGPEPMAVAVVLHRAGMDPDALASAGVQPAELAQVISQARTRFSVLEAALEVADGNRAETKRTVTALERLIRSGRAADEDIAALAPARAARDAAEAGCRLIVTDIGESGREGMEPSVVQQVETILMNRHWKLPTPYLVIERSEVDWVRLRNLLAIERIAAQDGEDVPVEVAQALGEVRSQPQVAAALDAHAERAELLAQMWADLVGAD